MPTLGNIHGCVKLTITFIPNSSQLKGLLKVDYDKTCQFKVGLSSIGQL